jgi:Protein of unknown function (DUF3303)
MLFMVVERFKESQIGSIGERFRRRGRMLPKGLTYQASWVDPTGARCFQVVDTARRELLDRWIGCWKDLIDFEVVPVVTSDEFWGRAARVEHGSRSYRRSEPRRRRRNNEQRGRFGTATARPRTDHGRRYGACRGSEPNSKKNGHAQAPFRAARSVPIVVPTGLVSTIS